MNSRFDRDRRRCLQLLGGAMALPYFGTVRAAPGPLLRKAIPGRGESLPVVGLGTSRVFDVGPDELEREGPLAVLRLLSEIPGAMIDTSPMYGNAERVIGELAAGLQAADKLFYATKVWTHGRDAGIRQMNRSFDLLRRTVIDLMQIHNLQDWQTHLHTLRDWKDEGRVRHIGITHYQQGAHLKLEQVIRSVGGIDFIQVNYSLLEPEAADRLLPLALDRGIAVIANRPFTRGNWFRLTRGRELPAWAREAGIASWAQFALKWIVSDPAVTVAIPGTGKPGHMVDNLLAARGTFLDTGQRRRMADLVRTF